MGRPSPSTAHHRARVAGIKRCIKTGERAADDPELFAAYVDLAESKIADFVAKVVSELPPLNDEQKARVSALFRAGGAYPQPLCARPPDCKAVTDARIAEPGGVGVDAA